jgi:uncharacterized protein
MGKKQEEVNRERRLTTPLPRVGRSAAERVKRVVLDTNVLVSALLFKGTLSEFVELWKSGEIVPWISKETFEELRAVLEYPKFSLSKDEIDSIIRNEILPYFNVIESTKDVTGICRDPEDNKFISCALSASAKYLVTGDKDLSDLKRYKSIKIMTPQDFLEVFD